MRPSTRGTLQRYRLSAAREKEWHELSLHRNPEFLGLLTEQYFRLEEARDGLCDAQRLPPRFKDVLVGLRQSALVSCVDELSSNPNRRGGYGRKCLRKVAASYQGVSLLRDDIPQPSRLVRVPGRRLGLSTYDDTGACERQQDKGRTERPSADGPPRLGDATVHVQRRAGPMLLACSRPVKGESERQ